MGTGAGFGSFRVIPCFIAFSNMRSRREMTNFKLSELFIIMCAIWTTHDTIEEDGGGKQ